MRGRAPERPVPRVGAERRDEGDRGASEAGAHDTGTQVELGLQRAKERLVDRRRENRIRGERCVPRRERERLSDPHRRVRAEGNVLLVEPEAVEVRRLPHAAARLGHHLGPDPVSCKAGDRIGSHDNVTSWTSSWMETAPPSSARALKRANATMSSSSSRSQTCFGAGAGERVAPGVLAERQRHCQAELVRVDDLVGRDVLEQPVLVDAGLVREGICAHDRLVRWHRIAGEPLDEARGGSDLRDVDAGMRVQGVSSYAHGHHDLFERGVPGALSDSVHRALELLHACFHGCERVRDGESEVVVAVRGEGDLFELGAQFANLLEERRVLGGKHVADGVREVDRGRPGLHGGTADGGDERGIGSGCVLARELDLVDARAGALDRGRRSRDDLVGPEAKLLLHVQRAGREKDVCSRAGCVGECGRRGIDVRVARAAERGDSGLLHGARDGTDAFEVAGRRGGEAGLDDVNAEPLELLADLHLLVRPQRDSRRLLAVPKRGVENCDPARAQRVPP